MEQNEFTFRHGHYLEMIGHSPRREAISSIGDYPTGIYGRVYASQCCRGEEATCSWRRCNTRAPLAQPLLWVYDFYGGFEERYIDLCQQPFVADFNSAVPIDSAQEIRRRYRERGDYCGMCSYLEYLLVQKAFEDLPHSYSGCRDSD